MKSVKLLIILLFYLNLIFIQAPPPFNEFDLKYEYYSINNVELTEMKSYMKGNYIAAKIFEDFGGEWVSLYSASDSIDSSTF